MSSKKAKKSKSPLRAFPIGATIAVALSLVFASYGYAAFTSQLSISGEAVVRAPADVRIIDLKIVDRSSGAFDNYPSKYSVDNTQIFVSLPPGGFLTYEITIRNNTDLDYEITEFTEKIFSNNTNVSYAIVDASDSTPNSVLNDKLPARTTKSFRIKFTNTTGAEQLSSLEVKYRFEEYTIPCLHKPGDVITFNTVGETPYTVTCKGRYTVEVAGAQGGTISATIRGGYGGFAKGDITLNPKDTPELFVNVGGQPTSVTTTVGVTTPGGYNGGGMGMSRNDVIENAGGGATHIATESGTLESLGKSKLSKVLIVAGGGGGSNQVSHTPARYGVGGAGGGTTGGNGSYAKVLNCESYGLGGTQALGGGLYVHTAYYRNTWYVPEAGFGFGSKGDPGEGGAGGGGGLYGGRGSTCVGGAGGGSGYIGGVTNGSMQNGTRAGNGYAKITYLGE